MIRIGSQQYRRIVILGIIIGFIAGCASVFQNMDDKLDRKRFKLDYELYENALAVYKNGDYEKAKGMFTALATASGSEKLSRKATLGEICCRLLLAETQGAYDVALDRWHDFVNSTPQNDSIWDPALLDPLILRLHPKATGPRYVQHPPTEQTSAPTVVFVERQPNEQPQKAETNDLKKKAEQISQLQRRLETIEAENRSLKEKIKALEAIDQNIRKKKTEIAAPGE
jgi:hypothetical protein